jgi:formylglycine-generating enzyme required for sulfatase activity
VGEDRSVPFLAMEFLEGQPLDQRLQREGKLPLREVLRIGREAAEGLAAAHKGGLIHRDIKPANLWLEGERGRVKILDFGLARAVRDQAHLTQAGVIMGTPAYMAPEQASAGSVDHRCDLFSLGCVLYQLCTGELPFKGTDTVSFLYAIATEIPRPPEEINPQVPPALSALVLRLLAKKAPERPASAQEVAEALASIQAGLEAKTEPRRSQPHQTQAWSNEPLQREATEEKGGKPRLSTSVSREGKEERGRPLARKPERGQSQRTLSSKGRKGVGDRAAWGLSGRRVWLVAAAVCGLVLLLVGIVVIIRNREGKEVARIVVPEGGSVETKTVDDGQPGAKPPGALPARYKNSLGMEFVLVPKGKFLMGGGGGQGILGTKEVEIPHDFYLGVYEVTQGEWQAVSGANPSYFSRVGRNKDAVKDIPDEELKRFPVEGVSWIDAQKFLEALNAGEKEAGWVYRLPKEAEWEYACRGGPRADKFEYGFDFYFEKPTNKLLLELANFAPKKGEGLQRTCKVGSYKPNSLGLYDMHGNVWEWCDEVPISEVGPTGVARGGS